MELARRSSMAPWCTKQSHVEGAVSLIAFVSSDTHRCGTIIHRRGGWLAPLAISELLYIGKTNASSISTRSPNPLQYAPSIRCNSNTRAQSCFTPDLHLRLFAPNRCCHRLYASRLAHQP